MGLPMQIQPRVTPNTTRPEMGSLRRHHLLTHMLSRAISFGIKTSHQIINTGTRPFQQNGNVHNFMMHLTQITPENTRKSITYGLKWWARRIPGAIYTSPPRTTHFRILDMSWGWIKRTKTNQGKRPKLRSIWESLKRLGDATDYELSIDTNILRSSAAKRRQELVDLGHVVATPFRRKTDTGTMAIVWRPSLVSSFSEPSEQ